MRHNLKWISYFGFITIASASHSTTVHRFSLVGQVEIGRVLAEGPDHNAAVGMKVPSSSSLCKPLENRRHVPQMLKDSEAAALRGAIHRYLVGRCRDAALAEDLAQDVLERVLRAMGLTEVRDPTALAYRVADNLLIDHHRSVARRPFVVLSPDQPAADASPAQTAEARAELARVMTALRAMPAQRRRIFIRRRYDGASCVDIAKEFGLSIKAVEKHITKALAELAAALAPSGERE